MDKRRNPEPSDLAVLAFVGTAMVSYAALLVSFTWPVPVRSNPAFVLRDATMYGFNATPVTLSGPPGPTYLDTTIGVTLSSRIPSVDSVGIDYFTLYAYATYRGQQITPRTLMAADARQGCKEAIEWSPSLEGRIAPVSLGALAGDLLSTGTVPIDVNIDGRMKWENSESHQVYPLRVNCPALLMLNTGTEATGSGLSLTVRSAQHCKVDVIS